MRAYNPTFIGIALIVFAGILHVFLRNNLFSFFIAPISLAIFFAYARRLPTFFTPTLVVISELFTSLPPGVMTLAIIIPFILKRLLSRVDAHASLMFYAAVLGVTAIQLIFIIIVDFFVQSLQFTGSLTGTISLTYFLISLGVTATITYVLIITHQELTPPS